MPIKINSPGWQARRTPKSRGAAQTAADGLPGLPPEFLTGESRVAEEAVVQPTPAARGGGAETGGALDLTCELGPDETGVLAIRHPSGALTFSLPIDSASRGVRGRAQMRFQVPVRHPATRGIVGHAIKAIVIKVAKVAGDKAVSFVLPKLADAFEKQVWKKRGLKEGWVKVSRETLAAGGLEPGVPVSPLRSLLLLHGSFSNAASAYRHLADTEFFARVKADVRRSRFRVRSLQCQPIA